MLSSCADPAVSHPLSSVCIQVILRAELDRASLCQIVVCGWRFTVSRGCIIDGPLKSTRCYRQVLAVSLHVNAVPSPCWDSFWGRTERSIIRNHSRLVQHTVGDSTAGWKVELTEIQLFEVCVVVGYASYSDCNEISQVQQYLKMLRLKHSERCC